MDQVWLCYVYDPNDDYCRESVVAVAATEELANAWLQECRGELFWRPDLSSVPGIRKMSPCSTRVADMYPFNLYPFNQPHVDQL